MNAAQGLALLKLNQVVRHYVRAIGLRAVYVARLPSGLITGTTTDYVVTERRLKARGGEIVAAWWTSSARDAEAAWLQADAFELATVGLRSWPGFTSHATIVLRATEAVEHIARKIADENRAGRLGHVNQGYRRLRLRRAALGLTTCPYTVYLRRYAILTLYRTAAKIRK